MQDKTVEKLQEKLVQVRTQRHGCKLDTNDNKVTVRTQKIMFHRQ
jgi:hypothetical protein